MPSGPPLTVITAPAQPRRHEVIIAPAQPRSHPAPKTARVFRPVQIDADRSQDGAGKFSEPTTKSLDRSFPVVQLLTPRRFSSSDGDDWSPQRISPKLTPNHLTPSSNRLTPSSVPTPTAGGAGRFLLLNALQAFSGRTTTSNDDLRSPRINRQILRRGRLEGSIHASYCWGEADVLGEGSFGKVYSAKSKHDHRQSFAVKKILRSGIQDVDELWSEISILTDLDHPNVLRFVEAYDDYKHIFVVTELCLGGDLDQWLDKANGSADFAKRIAKEVLGALVHCHSLGICHRDLKTGNILFVRNSIDSPVRVADFGVAKRNSKGVLARRSAWSDAKAGGEVRTAQSPTKMVRMSSFKGTPEFMAPEVIQILNAQVRPRHMEKPFYDFRCDIWSLGVVIHMLLTRDVPYSLEDLSANVAENTPLPELVKLGEGSALAEEARDFLNICLRVDFIKRPSARELQSHHWLLSSTSSLDSCSAEKLANRFVEFTGFSPLKRAALLAAARHLGPYEHEELRALFQKLDLQNSGQLTADNLRTAMRQVPGFLMPPCPDENGARRVSPKSHWATQMEKQLDSTQTGSVDYTEFLAAAMDHSIDQRRDLAWAAFASFDLGSKGFVSRGDLEHVVEYLSAAQLSELGELSKSDEVTFEQFIRLLS